MNILTFMKAELQAKKTSIDRLRTCCLARRRRRRAQSLRRAPPDTPASPAEEGAPDGRAKHQDMGAIALQPTRGGPSDSASPRYTAGRVSGVREG